MTIRNLWFEIRQDLKAWRRGEKRIAPYGTRGNVYAKRKADAPQGGLVAPINTKVVAILRPTRVYRAATDTWEDLPKDF